MKKNFTKGALEFIIMTIAVTILVIVCAVVAIWKSELITRIYFGDTMTILLNAIVFIIFALGIVQLLRAFHHYAFEENQVRIFELGMAAKDKYLFGNLSPFSNIYQRYKAVKALHEKRIPIDHGILASIMTARESTRNSFPKFVNNVLILTGVFGTIVSLIFALLGAGSLMQSMVFTQGMSQMLMAMNTALTTTATAIVCFFFFTFFYQRLTDTQTFVFARIEEAVLTYIIPEFSFETEMVNYKTEMLVRELRELVEELRKEDTSQKGTFERMDEHAQNQLAKLEAAIDGQQAQLDAANQMITRLKGIQEVLTEGFRLPGSPPRDSGNGDN